MDTYEATKIVMSRIQALDPENASKIMGYILIQDQGEKEMIRLAFGPETLLLSCINQAKIYFNRQKSQQQNSPRVLIPNNNGFLNSNNTTSPKPISSYASVLSGSDFSTTGSGQNQVFHGSNDFSDDFPVGFFDDPVMSPNGSGSGHGNPFHRRSCSVNDAGFFEEMGGGFGGFRPCMYFQRGFCKNGSGCKFSHSDGVLGEEMVGSCSGSVSPGNGGSGFDELLRLKAIQQQRFALMSGGGHNNNNLFGHSKSMSFVNENPRNDFSHLGLGCSSSRQIYLTFPADSTFKEEDVSSYFSMFGPVQDVRIPYQQKRMFGFVTFLYPETVKLILAKGNPHFVCDSRVLVKPYKEKGKIPDKKLHQLSHLDSGEYAACLSPSAIDSRENFDLPFGPRNLFNSQELMLRRKLEQEAELQHAIELQNRRMMNLQLMDLKNQHQHQLQQRNHNFLPSSPSGVPMFSPRQAQFLMNQSLQAPSDFMNGEHSEEFGSLDIAADEKVKTEVSESSNQNNIDSGKKEHVNADESGFPESMEHILPDNLFASPTKFAADQKSAFSQAFNSSSDNVSVTNTSSNKASVLPDSSPLGMASLKSCYFPTPSH